MAFSSEVLGSRHHQANGPYTTSRHTTRDFLKTQLERPVIPIMSFSVTSQPSSRVKVGQPLGSTIKAEYSSGSLKVGYLYMAYVDIVQASGTADSSACSRASCSAVQSPSSGKPEKLKFSFSNLTVRTEGQWRFVITIFERKEHLGNEWNWTAETQTSSFTAKK
ncbi:hypothetical protein CC79DRAFT_1351935 [Sarocladium strictum]